MQEIKITKGMLVDASNRARKLGVLKNSISKGMGNVAGMLGEEIVLKVLGGKLESNYDYDILLPDGTTTDVKTKLTTVKPLPEYSCSVSAYNIRQKCDLELKLKRLYLSFSPAKFKILHIRMYPKYLKMFSGI